MKNHSVVNTTKMIVAGLLVLVAGTAVCQNVTLRPQVIQYIEQYRSIAQEEMLRAGIPASITLAQGIHESSWGQSVLATDAKNHFGIKCHKEWTGPTYTYDDDEKGECFRVYNNAEHSYRDHSDFLTSRPRYAQLFTLDRRDYKGWATGLKAAGYATNPKYAEIIIKLVEDYGLHQYDDFNNATYARKTTESAPKTIEVPATEAPKTAIVVTEELILGSHNGIPSIVTERKTQPEEIATKYKVSLDDLLSYNEMNEGDHFPAGCRVYFAHKKKVGETNTHSVTEGESMWLISQQHGIKLHKLYEKNRMQMNEQAVAGETLQLHEKSNTAPKTISYEAFLDARQQANTIAASATKIAAINEEKAVTASTEKIYAPITSKVAVNELSRSEILGDAKELHYYEVQPKETLYAIARMFNVSVAQLREWNNLNGAEIKIGQQLIVGKR